MPNPPANTSPYPVITDVTNFARVLVNDTFAGKTGTAGEGRIFTDDAPFILPLLNEALADFQRRLTNAGVTTIVREAVLTPITAINSSLGLAVPNPAVQQTLSWDGFFDGNQLVSTPSLPSDCLAPIRLWERDTGSNSTFSELLEADDGLDSIYQYQSLNEWEWRGDSIAWNGATVSKDIRLRYVGSVTYYQSSLSPSAFSTTQLPFRDSVQALAYKMAYMFCSARLPNGGATELEQNYEQAVKDVINRQVRRSQHNSYSRPSYGDTGSLFGFFG